jgi:hypothetical protein
LPLAAQPDAVKGGHAARETLDRISPAKWPYFFAAAGRLGCNRDGNRQAETPGGSGRSLTARARRASPDISLESPAHDRMEAKEDIHMGGQAGGRGYLIQTLILVLDIMRDERDWMSVALEPDVASDKVDVLWACPDGRIAIQVKSSQNQIGPADARMWATELEHSYEAEKYELRLIGPCSDAVIQMKRHGKVKIPTPLPLNVMALIEQGAHKLDHYLEVRGISRVPPFARELIVNALAGRFAAYATDGQDVTREELDRLLGDWLLEIYPQSLNRAVEMQCTVLWSSISVPLPANNGIRNPFFIAPMTFLNDGIRTTIVEDLIVEVMRKGERAIYKPAMTVDLASIQQNLKRLDFSQLTGLFSEFALSPNVSIHADYVFVPIDLPDQKQIAWVPGTYHFRAIGFLADHDCPTLLRQRTLIIQRDLRTAFEGNKSSVAMQFVRPSFDFEPFHIVMPKD